MTGILSHNSHLTPIGLLHTYKIAEAVLPLLLLWVATMSHTGGDLISGDSWQPPWSEDEPSSATSGEDCVSIDGAK